MNTKISTQSQGFDNSPEKLYTQNEVDDLHKNWQDSLSSQAKEIEKESRNADIKKISNIFINSSAFFSQLVIISKTFEENEIRIINLRTKEAVFARRIIEGLRIFE